MQDKIKEVYEQIGMPEECRQRIEQAMRSRREDRPGSRAGYRRISGPAAALAAAFLLMLTNTTVYAFTGEGIISRIVSFAGNAVFTEATDEEGNTVSSAAFDTENAEAPAEFKEGRLWLTANGEHIDITDRVSDEQAYIYDYRDEEGITHYLILGGEPETFGYAEFMYDETKDPGWIGGYFTAGKVGEPIDPDWLQNAKKELGIPWP